MGVRLVAVVKENLDSEVDDFRRAVWPGGEIFLDKSMAFFKILFGGQVRRGSILRTLCQALSCGKAGQRIRAAAKAAQAQKNNLKGEGYIKGGVLVIRQGGPIEFAFAETELGEHADIAQVVAAATVAGGSTEEKVARKSNSQEPSVEKPRPLATVASRPHATVASPGDLLPRPCGCLRWLS
mmetsp:Transcript_48423/g.139068  ORF Transcript_48423/g.139068 Transcript_48423/m.139068 type:complete len:182 (+) Transcript_48423:346-891(+)